jgi:adenylate kinase family enzyme
MGTVARLGPRIRVVGASGNGKWTVARALAERLGLPYVELDALNHGPNWTEASDEDFQYAVEAATADGRWVVDGN